MRIFTILPYAGRLIRAKIIDERGDSWEGRCLSGRMPNMGKAQSNLRGKWLAIAVEMRIRILPFYTLCGGWRPLRATALPANASQKYALIHLRRWYNFAMRKSNAFSAFWKRYFPHFKKPSRMLCYSHRTWNYIWGSWKRLKCNFCLPRTLFFNYLQRAKKRHFPGEESPSNRTRNHLVQQLFQPRETAFLTS